MEPNRGPEKHTGQRQRAAASYVGISVLLAAMYFLAGKLGLGLALAHASSTTMWAPTGIALAALVVLGYAYWPAIFIASLAVQLSTAATLAVALSIAAGNTAEGLLGAWLIRRFAGGTKVFERQRTVLRFFFLAVLLSTAVSATAGASTLALSGVAQPADYGKIWAAWWLRDVVGAILITPLLVGLWTGEGKARWRWKRAPEAAALAAGLCLVGVLAATRPLKFLCIPLLLWAALRFGVWESAGAVLVLFLSQIWATLHGYNLLAGMDRSSALLLLQTYSGVLGVMTIVVAAAAGERKQAEEELRKSRDKLAGVAEITTQALAEAVSEERHALEERERLISIVEGSPDFIAIAGLDQKLLFVNRAGQSLLGFQDPQQVHRASIGDCLPEQERKQFEKVCIPRLMHEGHMAGETRFRNLQTAASIPMLWDAFLIRDPHTNAPAYLCCIARDITKRKQAEEALQELAGRLIHAQEAERRRIGRELHDDFSQRLALLAIRLDQLRRDAGTPEPATEASVNPPPEGRMAEGLAVLSRQIGELTEDIHRLSHGLHPAVLDHLGLLPALHSLIDEFSERHSMAIRFVSGAIPSPMPSEVALCLFRIVQEALNNAAKYSGVASARVELAGRADGVHLSVQDEGCGFDLRSLASKGGLGFVSMRERLRVLGGRLQIRSAPSQGTRIEVWIPSEKLEPQRAVGRAPQTVSGPAG